MSNIANFMLPNEPTCILACSAGSARLWLSQSRFGDWKLIEHIRNEHASDRESDLGSDRPGRTFDSVGKGRHAMSRKSTSQQHQALLFTRQIAGLVNDAIAENRVTKLVLLAAPDMLGYLRSELSDAALRAVALAKPMNVANLEESGIRAYFA